MLLADWLIVFLLPAMPALLDVVDIAVAHNEMSERKQAIEGLLGELWAKALKPNSAVTVGECRTAQDEVFKLRSLGLQIPQWFYRVNRSKDEMTMRDAAMARRQEFLSAHGEAHGRGLSSDGYAPDQSPPQRPAPTK